MKRNEVNYWAEGNIDLLCDYLRGEGFGVPYVWDNHINSSQKTRNICSSPNTLTGKIEEGGSITDLVKVGEITVDKDNNNQVAEFWLDVYLNQPRGEVLQALADKYEPTMEVVL